MSYRNAFGAVRAARILAALSGPGPLAQLKLPGFAAPVWLRRGTSDVRVFEQVFVLGDYDTARLDPAPEFILDGGSNIGLSAIFLARAYPNARIVAIEPDRHNFEMLGRNIEPYR